MVRWDAFIVSFLIASIATIVLYCVFCMCLSKFHKLEACTYSIKHGNVKCHFYRGESKLLRQTSDKLSLRCLIVSDFRLESQALRDKGRGPK